MPRDSGGNYTLATDPVVGGTPVDATWANPTLADVADALTDSLDRDGNGSMLSALQYTDGTQAAPGITWSSDALSGFRRAGQYDQRSVIASSDVVRHVQATEPAGTQHPHEIYDGASFRPSLLGVGGAKEQPSFAGGALEWANLTVGGNVAWFAPDAKQFDGVKVLNGREMFAWASVNGTTGAITNSRNVLGVVKFGPGFYRVVTSQDMMRFGFGISIVALKGAVTGWIECSNDGDRENYVLVFTGVTPGVSADRDFTITIINNMVDPPAVET